VASFLPAARPPPSESPVIRFSAGLPPGPRLPLNSCNFLGYLGINRFPDLSEPLLPRPLSGWKCRPLLEISSSPPGPGGGSRFRNSPEQACPPPERWPAAGGPCSPASWVAGQLATLERIEKNLPFPGDRGAASSLFGFGHHPPRSLLAGDEEAGSKSMQNPLDVPPPSPDFVGVKGERPPALLKKIRKPAVSRAGPGRWPTACFP